MIKVLFFAQLRELLGASELKLNLDSPSRVSEIKQRIMDAYPEWEKHLSNSALLTSVNQQLVDEDYKINAFDEVAFFPPVTGG